MFFIIIVFLVAFVGMLMLMRVDRFRRLTDPRQRRFWISLYVIVVPYSVLSAFGTCFLLLLGAQTGGLAGVAQAALIACGFVLPLLCGIRLSTAYAKRGPEGLARTRSFWWWGAYAGAAIPVIGLLAFLVSQLFMNFQIEASVDDAAAQPFGPARLSILSAGVFAAPLLIPLWQLIREKRRFTGSKPSHDRLSGE